MNKKLGKDILLVIISNGVKLISSVLSMFIVPILFTEQGYGFYSLFLIYMSYGGLLHFGFIDGIYLKYGGVEYDELEKKKFRSYTKFLMILETTMLLMVLLLGIFSTGDRQSILFLVAANFFGLNITSYFQFISQCTGRFKEFAYRNIIHTILTVILISIFYFTKINNYLWFISGTVLINIVLLFWYLYTYKDIVFGKGDKILKDKKDIINLFKLGIPLLLSNLVVIFISNIPKQFIEWRYPIERFPNVFSSFSFAFTLLSFTSVFLSAVSLVIYPTMKKADHASLKKNYNRLNTIVIVAMFFAISMYYPAEWSVTRFIPQYADSLKIFFILCPGISLTSSISVIKHNYYKTLNKNKQFLIIGIITTLFMIVTIFFAYFYISKDVITVAIVTVIVQGVWFVLTDLYISKVMNINIIRNIIYIVLLTSMFYLVGVTDMNRWFKMTAYLAVFLLITMIFFIKEIKKILATIKSKHKS